MAVIGMSAVGKSMSDEEPMGAVEAIASESAPVVERYGVGS